MRAIGARLLARRVAVASAAALVIAEGRRVELAVLPAVARVAILAEAAGALAALARKQAALSHVDPFRVAELVTDPADAFAVLGRGRWLPTMRRPVLTVPMVKPRPRRAIPARGEQLSLFSSSSGREVSGSVR